MRLNKMWLVALALPVVAAAQRTPLKGKPDAAAALAVMTANVGKITVPDEKARWEANAAAWQIVLSHPGVLPKVELDRVKSLVAAISENVGKVNDPAEKERWQADIDLWRILLASDGIIAKTSVGSATVLVEKIKANIAKIFDPFEKERWQANRDLWEVTLGRTTAIA